MKRSTALLFLLVTLPAFGQNKPHLKPPVLKNSSNGRIVTSDVYAVPRTLIEFGWMEISKKLVWKHVRVTFSPLQGQVIPYMENMTHPLPTYFDHDPKNLMLTNSSLEFDAVAGDLIAWKVAIR